MRNLIAFCFLCVLALTAGAQVSEEKGLYKPVGECPQVDGDKPVYLPDEEDLTIFYQCSKGRPWLMKCPPKTIFDPKLSVCVHSSSTTSSTSTPDITSPSTTPSTTRVTTTSWPTDITSPSSTPSTTRLTSTSGPSNITTSTPSPTSSTDSPTTV